MKNMKEKLMDSIKQGVSKVAGEVAMNTGESAVDGPGYCFFFDYEPEIPQELLKK